MRGKKSYRKKVNKPSKAVKTYVKKAISSNLEDKWTQYDLASATINATGYEALLNYGAAQIQGTGANNRVGDKIRIKHLDIRLLMAASQQNSTYFRVLVVKNKNPSGIALATTDLMFNTAGVGPIRPLYPKTYLNQRVEILYDKVFTISALGTSTADYHYKPIVIRKNLNVVTSFIRNLNTGTIADIDKNSIHLFILGGVDATSTANAQLRDLQYSVTFEDA